MGTNYYAHIKTCPTCKHPEKNLHIGKSSVGWTFTFQAITASDSPDERMIDSWKRWQETLARPDVEIWNEYDEPMPLDDFVYLVDRKKTEPRNHHLYCLNKYGQDNGFLDDEGNSFSWEYFT